MKFKTTVSKEPQHKDFVCCVGWNSAEEVYSCGDDHVLMKWNLVTKESQKVADLPADLFPTDFHWFPRGQGTSRKHGLDLILITSADGKFHFVNKTGRIEKSVEAHKGATLAGCWSYDSAGLLTAGEDGQVKVWSRSGMLRSTVVQAGQPVYSAVWGPDSNQVLHTLGNMLVIKPLAPNTKPSRWKAHDGLILKVVWNASNNMIISGGEDCRYKIWDTYGRQLFSSPVHDYPITSLAWAPDGDLFAVGSFNTLRLCDKTGWSHSLAKPITGSLFSIAWSSDGTQVAAACGNGHVILAHIVERRLEWSHLEATLVSRKRVSVRDVALEESVEKMELPDRVIKVALGHAHLVAALPAQCYIYSAKNWNTPVIFDLREGAVSMLVLSENMAAMLDAECDSLTGHTSSATDCNSQSAVRKCANCRGNLDWRLMSSGQLSRHFLLAERSSIGLYSYEGRLLCSPRWPNMQLEVLSESCVSVGPDTLAVRDQSDDKLVHLFGVGSGRSLVEMTPLRHTHGVVQVALNQCGLTVDRQIAFVDKNKDLFIATVGNTANRKNTKLGSMVESLCWNNSTNMLAAVQDANITIWYYPTVVFVDKPLIGQTALVRDSSEFGKHPTVVSFVGNLLSVRRSDGALMYVAASPYVAVLHAHAGGSRWDEALRLCRSAKIDSLWACLAAMATHAKDLTTAEESYAAINDLDKVEYIQNIKAIPSRAARLAMMTLMSGNVGDAETQLLQNGLVFRAIMINMEMHHWDRALELAVKHKTHVDTVLYFRKKYLEGFEKQETNEKYLQFKDEMLLDSETIENKVSLEYQREKETARG